MEFQSNIKLSFWEELLKRKIDDIQLDESLIPLKSVYNDKLNVLNLDVDSFYISNKSSRINKMEKIDNIVENGYLKIFNTLETFKTINKKELLQNTCPKIQNGFVVIVYADLKKYLFYYWVGMRIDINLEPRWERNIEFNKYVPKIADLKPHMDSITMIDIAVIHFKLTFTRKRNSEYTYKLAFHCRSAKDRSSLFDAITKATYEYLFLNEKQNDLIDYDKIKSRVAYWLLFGLVIANRSTGGFGLKLNSIPMAKHVLTKTELEYFTGNVYNLR